MKPEGHHDRSQRGVETCVKQSGGGVFYSTGIRALITACRRAREQDRSFSRSVAAARRAPQLDLLLVGDEVGVVTVSVGLAT